MTRRQLYGDGGMQGCYTSEGVHIPGCMGCAVFGHDHCTCTPKPPQSVLDRLDKLEAQMKELTRTERPNA